MFRPMCRDIHIVFRSSGNKARMGDINMYGENWDRKLSWTICIAQYFGVDLLHYP